VKRTMGGVLKGLDLNGSQRQPKKYRCRTYTPNTPRAGEERDSGERTMGGVNISTSRSRRQDEIDIEKKLSLQDLYPRECFARECPIIAFRLVDDRNVRRDTLLIDQPVEIWRRAIGGVGGKPARLEPEAFSCG
jgi:hypothetical protein